MKYAIQKIFNIRTIYLPWLFLVVELIIEIEADGNAKYVPAKMEVYSKSAVVSDAFPCADIGQNFLNNNGSAVDAAIGVLLCMGISNPHSSGIGGGFLMTIYTKKSGKIVVIDAREMAPAAISKTKFNKKKPVPALSVAIPGEVRGMELAHKLYGKLPWKELFQPAIRLAKEGFSIQKELAKVLRIKQKQIVADLQFREMSTNPKTGDILKEGEIMERRIFGNTLDRIAKNGADEFYLGDTGKKLIKDIKDFGGIITADDLKNYKAFVKKPTTSKFKKLTLYSVQLPGSGYILSFILSILSRYNLDKSSITGLKNSTLTNHRFLEASKYGYAFRTKLGNAKKYNIKKVISSLLSSEVISQIKQNIKDNATFKSSYYGADFIEDDKGTAHLGIIAPNGDAVSLTTSINRWFGAGLLSPSTGIILNGHVPQTKTNFIEPGKRTQTTMCPSILVDEKGNVNMVVGAAGGIRIISAVSQTIMRNLWLEMNIKEAIDEPRIYHHLVPNAAEAEFQFSDAVSRNLEQIGHVINRRSFKSSVVGIKRLKNGKLSASFDYRKGGSVAGS